MVTLVSFDIDGTLEVGDPPGIITLDMVQRIRNRGWRIGTCSDRPVLYQQELWRRWALSPDFTVLKHHLEQVKQEFAAHRYLHIGDTDIDDYYATRAGFRFLRVVGRVPPSWVPELWP